MCGLILDCPPTPLSTISFKSDTYEVSTNMSVERSFQSVQTNQKLFYYFYALHSHKIDKPNEHIK